MKIYLPEVLPEWFLLMADNTMLSSSEIASLFGYKNCQCLPLSFPVPDLKKGDKTFNFSLYKHRKVRSYTSIKKSMWKKSTILKEIERRKEINNG